ncbi:alpha/beta fold hydrolase [Alcaligenaceae bacterium]|nr:alpha/beta fold hydrolase [Alcaligenaceae bacterium]
MSATPHTFVLVHGAWHGGWCWVHVADRLRAQGHQVYTPTLTGVGERSHLLQPGITLQTFIQDIANVLIWEDLHNVTLVGHSFGGLVITGVADILPERLRQLVYLDAFILESGISTFDTLPPEVVAKLRAAATEQATPVLAAPKAKNLGLSEAQDIAFVESRLTPMPLGVYETALQLQHPIGNGLPCAYVHCKQPSFAAVEGSRQWVKENTQWNWSELPTGHDAMVSAPSLLAEHLNNLLA